MFVGFLTLLAIVNAALAWLLVKQWGSMNRLGRVAFGGFALLFYPLGWSSAVAVRTLNAMKDVAFCESCHVMEGYVQSLAVDDDLSIPAIHYQNNWTPQQTACYDCHTSYSMFGPLKAKINGLKHVWVNYVTGPPAEIKLYEPYVNGDCLHCHGPSKRFLNGDFHVDDLDAIRADELSCLDADCHSVGHVIPEN